MLDKEFYDKFFGVKNEPGKVFNVTVIKAHKPTFWYANRIGERFDVVDNGGEYLSTVIKYDDNRFLEEGCHIRKMDASINTF